MVQVLALLHVSLILMMNYIVMVINRQVIMRTMVDGCHTQTNDIIQLPQGVLLLVQLVTIQQK
jgi:hypothetical protein